MRTLLALVTLSLIGCAQTSGASHPLNAVFFGDSITQRDPGYAPTIAHDMGWTYVNHAVGGTQIDRTHDEIMKADLDGKQIALLFVGYNDMRFNGMDLDHLSFFKAELKESLQYLSYRVVHVYLGNCFRMYTPNYLKFPPFDKGSDEAAEAYSQVISEVVSKLNLPNITLIDTTHAFRPAPEMYDDLVHPSVIGTARLVEIFEQSIKK